MTAARCPVCRSREVVLSPDAAACSSCDHRWSVEQLALELPGLEADPPRHRPGQAGTPLAEIRAASHRTLWLSTRGGDL